jgi:hypothetical protein
MIKNLRILQKFNKNVNVVDLSSYFFVQETHGREAQKDGSSTQQARDVTLKSNYYELM